MKPMTSVVLVGRTNVAKSALFNRLTETTKALVSKTAGTTRDYNRAAVSWNSKTFELIDTGGVDIETLHHSIEALIKRRPVTGGDEIERAIIRQTKHALEHSGLVLMVIDTQAGLLPADRQLALILKKLGRPVLLVSNKADNMALRHQTSEGFTLGLGTPFGVSAINGSGSGDLLDEIAQRIKAPRGRKPAAPGADSIAVAVIGKPNVGKSSLVNQILGEERVIVSASPHTTREPQDTDLTYHDQPITLIDTAGLRRQKNAADTVEKMAVRKTLATIRQANVVLLVTDISQPLTVQDSRLARLVQDAKVGVIIVANKWDLLTEKTPTIDTTMIRLYQRFFPSFDFAPLAFVSAKTAKNVGKLLDLVVTVDANRRREVPAEKLEAVLKALVKKHRPAQAKGPRRPRLYQLQQTKTGPPVFTVTVGSEQSIHRSYLRFIKHQLRQAADFTGVPLTIDVKAEKN